jgi:hypothetical protein
MENMPVKVEGNLIEYPFFWLGGKKRDIYKEYELGEIVVEKNIISKRKLVVENMRGIPGPYDQDVLMGILRIGTKKNKLTEDIPLTIYEIAKEIDDLKHRMRVRESVEKLVTTNYKSEQVILIKETGNKYYLNDLFHILDGATFLDSAVKNKRKSNSVTKVRFNKFFITNFENDYYKYIDLKKYLEMGSPTAKRLYMYLEKKKYNKETFQINLDTLAGIFPLEVTEYYEIRKVLKKAHEKLIEQAVIESFEYNKNKVIYHFPKTAERKEKKSNNEILDSLIKSGITEKTAEKLIEEHTEEKIKRQIKNIKYRKGENLPGVLVKSIIDDWADRPEIMKEEKEEEEKKQAKIKELEKKREKEFDKKIEEVIQSLSEDKMNEYYERVEKHWKEEEASRFIKTIPQGYQRSLIKKYVCEEFCIN